MQHGDLHPCSVETNLKTQDSCMFLPSKLRQRQKRKVKTDSVVRLLKTAWGTLKLTYGTAFILYSKYELGAK